MVKIIYGEHIEQADLAGKSVAEVRELYKSEFSIPNRAQASLNGQQLKKKLEPETKLGDEDKLAFEEKSRRGLVLLGVFLLALAITGGLFAYTYTTMSTSISVIHYTTDFVDVSANATGIANMNYTILGKRRGAITGDTMFDVVRDANYNGDIEVQIALTNAEELSQDYSFWMLSLRLQDVTGANVTAVTEVLSLNNPMVSFYCDNWTDGRHDRYVECLGGSYRTLPGSWLTGSNPGLFCQAVQASP